MENHIPALCDILPDIIAAIADGDGAEYRPTDRAASGAPANYRREIFIPWGAGAVRVEAQRRHPGAPWRVVSIAMLAPAETAAGPLDSPAPCELSAAVAERDEVADARRAAALESIRARRA